MSKYGFVFLTFILSSSTWAFEMKGADLVKALTEAKANKCTLSEKKHCDLFIFLSKNTQTLALSELTMDKKITMKGNAPSFREIGEFFERLKISPLLDKDLQLINSKTLDGTPRTEEFQASVSYKK